MEMTFFDDDRPVKKTAHEIGQDLSMLSVDDLAARIDLLKQEILRLEADVEKKQAGRSAADSLFRR
jgi:uncharacterized small protein (DUF1192 family)